MEMTIRSSLNDLSVTGSVLQLYFPVFINMRSLLINAYVFKILVEYYYMVHTMDHNLWTIVNTIAYCFIALQR